MNIHWRLSSLARKLLWLFCMFLIVSVSAKANAKGKGFLMDIVSGPKEGNIKLRDEQGNWMVVDGYSVNPPTFTKESVAVGIIDSGVIPDHPQLKGLIDQQRDFTGEGVLDRIGHGTVVTILVRASDKSMSENEHIPSPRFLIAKVANADGSINRDAVIEAIDWTAKKGARVVNLSLGFREGTDDYSGICDVIQRHQEVLFLAAAGNFGPTVKVYPAACKSENLIAVGAVNSDGTIPNYSGHGDVVAPGTTFLRPMSK
jgi:subtilisin family serine protease